MKSTRMPIVVIVLVVALMISLGLNYFVFRQGQQYYRQLNQVRLDPLGLRAYPRQAEAVQPNKIRIVFYGDSRAFQWPEPPRLKGFEFINRGVGAQTSTQVVGRYDEHVRPLKADILLIQMCINDLKTIPLFPESREWIVAQCQENIRWTVQQARSQGTTVILTTIFPLGKLPPERSLFWSDDVGEAIEEVNRFIHSLEEAQVIVLDTGEVLAGQNGLVQAAYSQDLLHLNETGYQALNQRLVDLLEPLAAESR